MGPSRNAPTRKRTRAGDRKTKGATSEAHDDPSDQELEESNSRAPSPADKRKLARRSKRQKKGLVPPNTEHVEEEEREQEQEEDSENETYFPSFDKIAETFTSPAHPAQPNDDEEDDADDNEDDSDEDEAAKAVDPYDIDHFDFAEGEKATTDSGVDVTSAAQHDNEQRPIPRSTRATTRKQTQREKDDTSRPGQSQTKQARTRTAKGAKKKKTPTPENTNKTAGKKKRTKKSTKDTEAEAQDAEVRLTEEIESPLSFTAEELLTTVEIEAKYLDGLSDLMGYGDWTAAGEDWANLATESSDTFTESRSKSRRKLGKKIARLACVCTESPNDASLDVAHLSKVSDRLGNIEELLASEMLAKDVDRDSRAEDTTKNIIPRAVILLRAFALGGERDRKEDSRLFHSIPRLRILVDMVDLILALERLLREDQGTSEHRPALKRLRDHCKLFRNVVVKAKNGLVQQISDAREAAAEARRARRRDEAAAARELEAKRAAAAAWRERNAKVQSSIQEFLTQEDDRANWLNYVQPARQKNGGRRVHHARPTWSEKCSAVMVELRASDHPNLFHIAEGLGCTTDEVWVMVDAIKDEAERCDREDGIPMPADLFRALANLYE